jgi:ATP-dependent exoDNAse (exonuclease V) beta subunit
MSKQQENLDAVTLMTLHAAKGLEFDTIILTGLEQGLLPSSRSLGNEASLEEERRLFYVGITRARERLLITHSRYRYAYRNMADQMPSWFLQEIPRDTIAQEDCSYWKPNEFKTYFSQWFGLQPSAYSGGSVMTFGAAQRKESPAETPAKKKSPFYNYKKTVPSVTSNSSMSSMAQTTPVPHIFKHATVAPFKMRQSVQHAKFGIGLVTEIEEKGNDVFFVTVSFKTGKKKLDSKFLTKI